MATYVIKRHGLYLNNDAEFVRSSNDVMTFPTRKEAVENVVDDDDESVVQIAYVVVDYEGDFVTGLSGPKYDADADAFSAILYTTRRGAAALAKALNSRCVGDTKSTQVTGFTVEEIEIDV